MAGAEGRGDGRRWGLEVGGYGGREEPPEPTPQPPTAPHLIPTPCGPQPPAPLLGLSASFLCVCVCGLS